jgi:hypothetical protein
VIILCEEDPGSNNNTRPEPHPYEVIQVQQFSGLLGSHKTQSLGDETFSSGKDLNFTVHLNQRPRFLSRINENLLTAVYSLPLK